MCSLIDRRKLPSFHRIYPLKRSNRVFRPTESGDKAGELLTGKIDSEAFFTAIRRKTGRGKELSKSYEQKSALFLKKQTAVSKDGRPSAISE